MKCARCDVEKKVLYRVHPALLHCASCAKKAKALMDMGDEALTNGAPLRQTLSVMADGLTGRHGVDA